ncbi:MAG: type I-C CRISPR-associated protein Cas5 [Proteobacteria bacterium]|nr:type I-C CRISPR-associated protein Cas5 [Pseudomonadota bacterium]
MPSRGFCLEVFGDYACFTRPEMKVERVSYDVITPSAARAIFEAILWKPAIRWQITRIDVCNPIRWISVRRNEVGAVVSTRNAETAMRTGTGDLGLYVEDHRQQRAGLFLRDVRYRLHAKFERLDASTHKPNYPHLVGKLDDPDEREALRGPESDAKYAAMFERRASKGQCFNQPYLGTREFACRFRLIDPAHELFAPANELRGIHDLGWMLYDLNYGPPPYSSTKPLFFRATLRDGVLDVPARDSEEVRG